MILLLIFLSSFSSAQNWPACDSLDISCCTYNVFGPNTITITVTNNSSVLFDYPSFVLFDSNMDTIAIETVNYFGIGSSPQPHTMNIVAPLNLPLTGFLNLYSLFFDTLACSFPFTVPDTIIGLPAAPDHSEGIFIYPGTDGTTLEIHAVGLKPGPVNLSVSDIAGRVCFDKLLQADAMGNTSTTINLDKGIYLISIYQNKTRLTKKIVQ